MAGLVTVLDATFKVVLLLLLGLPLGLHVLGPRVRVLHLRTQSRSRTVAQSGHSVVPRSRGSPKGTQLLSVGRLTDHPPVSKGRLPTFLPQLQ